MNSKVEESKHIIVIELLGDELYFETIPTLSQDMD